MGAKTKMKKAHEGWSTSRSERGWYYLGDTARMFCSSLVGSYMTLFLIFQGVSTASVAWAILLVKIIAGFSMIHHSFLL